MAAPLLIWTASALLLWQAIATTQKWTRDVLAVVAVDTHMEIVALAGALAALATGRIGIAAWPRTLQHRPRPYWWDR